MVPVPTITLRIVVASTSVAKIPGLESRVVSKVIVGNTARREFGRMGFGSLQCDFSFDYSGSSCDLSPCIFVPFSWKEWGKVYGKHSLETKGISKMILWFDMFFQVLIIIDDIKYVFLILKFHVNMRCWGVQGANMCRVLTSNMYCLPWGFKNDLISIIFKKGDLIMHELIT
jgi:hypothetical protein